MHHLEKVKRWFSPSGNSIDEDVKIAVRSRVAARPRSKNGEFGHALRSDRRRDLAQLGDDFFQGDVRNVAHGSKCYHKCLKSDYSAASLCPSLALSLWISSSAASAITVPGGKIASAPALYSASSSCGGTPPPMLIMMSSRPCFFSAAFNPGPAVRCAPASDDSPRMCTSFSTACRA